MNESPIPTPKLHNSIAYQSWAAARDELSRNIHQYAAACSILAESFSNPTSVKSTSLDTLRQTISAFDTILPDLPKEEKILQSAHSVLKRSRNKAKLFCPINNLPRELLAKILLFSYQGCECPIDNNSLVVPNILASVCHSWRLLVLDTPLFWSHLDLQISIPFIPENQLHSFDLWEERSGSADLTMDLVVELHPGLRKEEEGEYLNPNSDVLKELSPRPVVWDFVEILTPIADRVVAIEITLIDFPSVPFLEALIGCFATLCNAGRVDSFKLRFRPAYPFQLDEPLDVFSWNEGATVEPACCEESQVQNFLNSVSILELDSIAIPDKHMIPANLRDLSLSEARVDLSQLITILELCPLLQRLSLVNVDIEEEEEDAGSSIYLPHLRYLTITQASDELLSLLNPGDLPLIAHIRLSWDTKPIQAFFARSNIIALHVSCSSEDWFAHICPPPAHLKKLTLEGCRLNDTKLLALLDSTSYMTADADVNNHSLLGLAGHSKTSSVIPWPHLQTLSLVDCNMEFQTLKRLVALHSIQKFQFIDRRQPMSKHAIPKHWTLKLMEQELSEIVPDCKFSGNWVYYCQTQEERLEDLRKFAVSSEFRWPQ